MDTALQPILALMAIGLSVFSLTTYLWLGVMVLLLGTRRSRVTWFGAAGLLLGALFFLCHGALVGAGVPDGSTEADFWWHLAWVPGFATPLFWAATGLHYAGLAGTWRRWRIPALLAVAAPGAGAALLALANWNVIGRYGDFIRILGASLSSQGTSPSLPPDTSPALPALGALYITYIAACAALPWIALLAQRRLDPTSSVARRSVTGESALLWDAADAWSKARKALLGASLCMMGAGAVVAFIGIFSSLAEHEALLRTVSTGFRLGVPATPAGHVPLILVAADLCVQVALAGLGLLVGLAVVRQGILIERRLPQRGYLSHWRVTTVVAAALACVAVAMVAAQPVALGDVLVLVAFVTITFALFTWQSYGEHDRFLAQMRPFVTSLTSGHTGWLSTHPAEVERDVEALFTSLCRDVLAVSWGRLTISAGRLHRTFAYTDESLATGDSQSARGWVLPVMDERGVVARMALGPRSDGAGYTSADLEIARACGQRILDAVGEFAAAQAIASLARRRGLEAELSAALPRRVLHDDVLPRLHLAMLRLESLRGRVARQDGLIQTDGMAEPLGEVVSELGHVHHDLAALMRAAPAVNPRRVQQGFAGALRTSLDGEFRGTFDELEWNGSADDCAIADQLAPITADLLLGATLEAVRNAGRHARGDDLHRHLALRVSLSTDSDWVTVKVEDNGVGLESETLRGARDGRGPTDPEASFPGVSARGGTHTGLLTHGALVALVGGGLAVKSVPGEGTAVTIRVPRATAEAELTGAAPATA